MSEAQKIGLRGAERSGGAVASLVVLLAVVAVAAFASCGGSQSARTESVRAGESGSAVSADSGSPDRASPDAPLPARPGRLWRRDVVTALSRGLGDFLSRLEVEPVLAAGKFRGWRILKLRAGDPLWQGSELAPGDVITAVNERPIERPEQAFAAFQSLAVAKELRVTYERGSARRDMVYAIDDASPPP